MRPVPSESCYLRSQSKPQLSVFLSFIHLWFMSLNGRQLPNYTQSYFCLLTPSVFLNQECWVLQKMLQDITLYTSRMSEPHLDQVGIAIIYLDKWHVKLEALDNSWMSLFTRLEAIIWGASWKPGFTCQITAVQIDAFITFWKVLWYLHKEVERGSLPWSQ